MYKSKDFFYCFNVVRAPVSFLFCSNVMFIHNTLPTEKWNTSENVFINGLFYFLIFFECVLLAAL